MVVRIVTAATGVTGRVRVRQAVARAQSYLVERGQHLVRHVVLQHHRRDEHLVKVRVVGPDGLVDGFVLFQDLSVFGKGDFS